MRNPLVEQSGTAWISGEIKVRSFQKEADKP